LESPSTKTKLLANLSTSSNSKSLKSTKGDPSPVGSNLNDEFSKGISGGTPVLRPLFLLLPSTVVLLLNNGCCG
jgi:hypothetical protein